VDFHIILEIPLLAR